MSVEKALLSLKETIEKRLISDCQTSSEETSECLSSDNSDEEPVTLDHILNSKSTTLNISEGVTAEKEFEDAKKISLAELSPPEASHDSDEPSSTDSISISTTDSDSDQEIIGNLDLKRALEKINVLLNRENKKEIFINLIDYITDACSDGEISKIEKQLIHECNNLWKSFSEDTVVKKLDI